jgi:hypothetical protein
MAKKPVGWRRESVRHGLAARGIKTRMKIKVHVPVGSEPQSFKDNILKGAAREKLGNKLAVDRILHQHKVGTVKVGDEMQDEYDVEIEGHGRTYPRGYSVPIKKVQVRDAEVDLDPFVKRRMESKRDGWIGDYDEFTDEYTRYHERAEKWEPGRSSQYYAWKVEQGVADYERTKSDEDLRGVSFDMRDLLMQVGESDKIVAKLHNAYAPQSQIDKLEEASEYYISLAKTGEKYVREIVRRGDPKLDPRMASFALELLENAEKKKRL